MKPQRPEEVTLNPIGWVKNGIKEPMSYGWEEVVSEVELIVAPEILDGIEGFSHLIVLFWMHRVSAEARSLLKIHPKDRQDLPLVGVIATRTQNRPNPLGMTTVSLLGRKGNRLKVKGLDAINGTPVIDIKPYLPPYDALGEAKMPDWVRGLGYTDSSPK